MRKIQLRNGRMINHIAYHDLFIDGVEVLHEKIYVECFDYMLNHGNDNDIYTEPDACPNYKGETVKVLREKEKNRNWDY